MFGTFFGRKQSPTHRNDSGLRFRAMLTALETRDVPAVVYDNTFALTGFSGEALVRVVVDNPYPAATPTYIWTYTVTNVDIGSNNPQDYIDSDSQTSFWVAATAAVADAKAEFALSSKPTGWGDWGTNNDGGLFAGAAGDTTIYFGLYAGVNVDHPNLGHGESATLAFTTAPRLIVPQPATFGDDTFGETSGQIVGPGQIISTSLAGKIGGVVWVDDLTDSLEEGDGIRRDDELGLPIATVSLLDQIQALLAQTISDSSGRYQFPGLPTGTFIDSLMRNESVPSSRHSNFP